MDRHGSPALVTGVSAGLGARFACRFAERGANLILVARRGDRLDALADHLRAQTGAKVVVYQQDSVGFLEFSMLVGRFSSDE